jgi:hypothetical protein
VSKDKSNDLTSALNEDTKRGLNKEPTGALNKDTKGGFNKKPTSVLNKDTQGGLNKEPTGGLGGLDKDSTGSLNKDSKNHNKEESALPQPARPLPTALPFPAKTPVALEFPTSQPDLAGGGEQFIPSQNGNSGGPAQHPEIAPHPFVTALPALPAVAGVVAFALRLTSSSSETIKTLPAVIPATPLAVGSSARVPSLELAQTALPAAKESVSSSTPLCTEVGPKPPPEDQPRLSAPIAAPVGNGVRAERTSEPLPISNPAPVPKNTEDPMAWSWPPSPQRSTENIAVVLPQKSSETAGPTPKSEPSVVAAVPAYSPVHQTGAVAKTDNIPDIPRRLPGPSSAVESGMSRTGPKEAKVEPAATSEFKEFRQSDSHIAGSGQALAVPAWPSDAGGAPDTRIAPETGAGSATADDSGAPKVASEPEIKMGVAPPITRQISLNLSSNDSTQVNIGFTERAGKVLVAVRTPDTDLAQSLRTDLGDLVGRLEAKGFKTETWTPALAHAAEAAPSQFSNSNAGFNQPQHSGPGSGGGQQRQGQNGPTQRQKARWAAQLKETISADENRSEK